VRRGVCIRACVRSRVTSVVHFLGVQLYSSFTYPKYCHLYSMIDQYLAVVFLVLLSVYNNRPLIRYMFVWHSQTRLIPTYLPCYLFTHSFIN